MSYEEKLLEIQMVVKTWPAAKEAVSRALSDSDFYKESSAEIASRILKNIGFENPRE